MPFFDQDNTANIPDWLVPQLESIVYYSRQLGATGFTLDNYDQYSLVAKRKQLKAAEKDLGGVIAESGDLTWQLWLRDIANAVPLNGAPAGMPDPKVDDYLIAAIDNSGWTVIKISPRKMLQNNFELAGSSRD